MKSIYNHTSLFSLFLFAVLFLGFSCGKKEKVVDEGYYYTCSMDPQVMETKPGKCPVCKMPLTAVKKEDMVNDDELHLSDQQVELGHIVTDTINEQVLGDELFLTGELSVDQNKVTAISTKVMGRIERLYHKSTGVEIKKGTPIYEIYSEDLDLAARELFLAAEKKRTLKTNGIDDDKIIQSARNKLILYGLTNSQITEIENGANTSEIITITSPAGGVLLSIDTQEGKYVIEGESVYHVADLSTLWAEVQVYTNDLMSLKEGMAATLFFPGMEDLKMEGKISFVNPELNSSSKINLVRVEVPNKTRQLKPGMQVNVSILWNKVTALALPTDAIIAGEKGASVWIKTGHNTFKSIMVETGIETNEYTEIRSGLNHGDEVVISGAYLLSSEYLFKKGAKPMEGHDMGNMKM